MSSRVSFRPENWDEPTKITSLVSSISDVKGWLLISKFPRNWARGLKHIFGKWHAVENVHHGGCALLKSDNCSKALRHTKLLLLSTQFQISYV
jgi:hypothetical protein